ncbi:MAG TPA: multicopper oxidase domain-containing protein [Candidatus Limnocylindrales bacterium]|nr:multicopper oxidase domain-containing protein [Candidatus Limnocylindrales bacterium]
MRLARRRIVLAIAAIALVTTACGSANTPKWTFGAPATPPPAGVDQPIGTSGAATTAVASTIEIEAFDLGYTPAAVTVAAAGTYEVSFANTGMALHDLTFADGTVLTAEAGKTVTGQVTVPAGGLAFICSIPGHAPAGMTGLVSVGGDAGMPGMGGTPAASAAPGGSTAAAPVADPNAPPYELRDPAAPDLMPGTVHDVDFPIIEKDITVAEGFVVHAWTFGGTVPGPTLRAKVGDTINVNLTNQGQMSHSIDFHASETAMNHQMIEIAPGETFTYTFKANYAGVWMYHCGTAPALHHIANGMFGMVIIEPKEGLPEVDQEFAFVQSEWYLGAQKAPASYEKANQTAAAPDFVVFNGIANQYKDNPIAIETGKTVRVFVLDAGPSIDSSFHVVGTIFDQVVKEGVWLQRGNEGSWGSQAVDLAPAQGAIVEFTAVEDGMYPFVTHAFNLVTHGALGIFSAGDGDPLN